MYVITADGTQVTRVLEVDWTAPVIPLSWQPLPVPAGATPTPTSTITPIPPTPTPLSASGVGGGTGRILYSCLNTDGVEKGVFSMIDLHDGNINDLVVPDGITRAEWVSDGLQLMVNKISHGLCGGIESLRVNATPEPCLGFMTVSTGTVTILPNFSSLTTAALSPDRRQMAYVGPDEDDEWGSWVADLDGTNARMIKHTTAFNPVWSPDGRFIAFTDEDYVIIVALDGTSERELAVGNMPSWSSDSQSLIYVSGVRNNQIAFVSTDGEDRRILLEAADNDLRAFRYPVWSPDGTLIAFARDNGLYLMKADGSNVTRIAETEGTMQKPSWQPLPMTTVGTPTPPPPATPTIPTATPLSTEEVGGGTGGILFYENGSSGSGGRFHVYNLRDNTLSDPTLPEQVYRARWTASGQLLVGQYKCVGVDESRPCEGLVNAQNMALPLPSFLTSTFFDLSADGSRVAFVEGITGAHRRSGWRR